MIRSLDFQTLIIVFYCLDQPIASAVLMAGGDPRILFLVFISTLWQEPPPPVKDNHCKEI